MLTSQTPHNLPSQPTRLSHDRPQQTGPPHFTYRCQTGLFRPTSEPTQCPYVCPDSSFSPETLAPETPPVPVLGSSDVTVSIQQYARILLLTKAGPSSSYCGRRYVWRGPGDPTVPGHSLKPHTPRSCAQLPFLGLTWETQASP